MGQYKEKPTAIERLNKFLNENFPEISTDWQLSQDGTAVLSDLLAPEIAKSYKHKLNQLPELKDKLQLQAVGSEERLIIPIQALVCEF